MSKKYYVSLDKELVDTLGFEEALFLYYIQTFKKNEADYIHFNFKNLFENVKKNCGYILTKWRQAEIIEKLEKLSIIYIREIKNDLLIKVIEQEVQPTKSINDESEKRIKEFASEFRRLHKENYPSLPVPLQGGIKGKERAQIINILKFLDKNKENSVVFLIYCFTNKSIQPPSGSPSIGWIAYTPNQLKFLKFKGKNGETSKSNTFNKEEEQILENVGMKF